MPRNPKRIERIAEKLALLWKMYPDLRLGQLLENLPKPPLRERHCVHGFEDEQWELWIDNALEEGL